jgi:glyoxylase-like metal-dependent hydrolase (beta-lactamase superfamily II)
MPMAPISQVLERTGVTVFERGWLSSNNVLIQSSASGPLALIDSGYCSHADQTLALVTSALGTTPLDLLLNTHLHSDHCGGNAALQSQYPHLSTLIPPGHADAVAIWDSEALTFAPTGQQCPRFRFDGLLVPGQQVILGDWHWQVHGSKGHDPHSIVLHQADNGLLISADALWENGFGVVFPELEGVSAFDEVEETLNLIEALNPVLVIPGHGPLFQDVAGALERARSRLARFRGAPAQHLRHAQKVLIKFRLLEWQSIERQALLRWAMATPYLRQAMPLESAKAGEAWLATLLAELERSQALRQEGDLIINC